MFSLRIVNVDHYMSPPKSGLDLTYSQFRGAQVKSVPVLRIFGSTPSGKKTCLHIHGVFPYILVPYSGEDDAGRLMYQLASSLDKAINVSQNTSHSTRQHVFKIVQVSGRPFYGYHGQDHQFFKIFFYNPLIVKRACDLLQNGAVCGTKFQIHEGHVPFTLQFFIDYNLYGMSYINLKSVIYRKDASSSEVPPDSLPKESCCELEADAVAVDILNRLTIEGELAVNPGLAAIWREEKKRLKRDALEVSQRPKPPLAMSEVLLREKLRDNLKFQGKCKTPLRENIPYPVQTQRTTGSGIMDASMLDTHSVSSLASARSSVLEETTVVDEDLVLSLTQSSVLSSSLDQSLLVALDNLAAQHEVHAVMSQNVEDDSILGSQMLPEQDLFENDISDGELETLNFSLPPDVPCDNHSEYENEEESDENFEENIPQLDGVSDFSGKKKKKHSKRKRRVLVENSATETYPPSDGEEILLNNIKDNNCWPVSGKQETLEEIFSDEEPYNSPINNFEDSCVPFDLEPINVDLLNSFETVLRGDPSFTSEDLASEDVMFQPLDENVDDSGERKSCLNEEQSFKGTENVIDKKLLVDKNSNTDSVPSFNSTLDATEMDKSVMLGINGEELLNTSQLDEIFNEDLNKGLEIICEKSPQQEFEESLVKPGDTSEPFEIKEVDENSLNDEILATTMTFLCNSEERETEEIIDVIDGISGEHFELPIDVAAVKFVINDPSLSEIQPSNDETSSLLHEKKSNHSPKKDCCTSPLKGAKSKLYVKILNKKNKKTKQSNLKECQPEMSRKEIRTYFSQLKTVARYMSKRPDLEQPHPMLWTPIRESMNVENAENKRKRKRHKLTSSEKIMKKCKFSNNEILKMKGCRVRVHKLTENEINVFSGKVSQLSDFNENKTNYKNDGAEKSRYSEKYSLKLSDKMLVTQLQEKSHKPKNNDFNKSHCSKSPPLQSPHKVLGSDFLLKVGSVVVTDIFSETRNVQTLTCKGSKLQKMSEKVQDKQSDTKVKRKNTTEKTMISDVEGLSLNGERNITCVEKTEKIIKTENNIEHNLDATSLQDQSSNFKLNTNCILRLIPLPVDSASETGNKASSVAKVVQRKENSVDKRNESVVGSQNHKAGEDPEPEKLNEEFNINPFVRVEKLVTSLNSDCGILLCDNEIKSDFKSKNRSLKKDEELNSVKNKILDEGFCRKRPIRICSLDGTVDNSSSDENVNDKGSTNKPLEICSTPVKKRKSKSCRSPRNYAPLDIEIKKSPKLKLKSEMKKTSEPVIAEGLTIEHRNKAAEKDVLQNLKNQAKWDNSKCHEKRKRMEPLVFIERLSSVTNLQASTSDLTIMNQPIASTSSSLIDMNQPVASTSSSLTDMNQPVASSSSLIDMNQPVASISSSLNDMNQPVASTSSSVSDMNQTVKSTSSSSLNDVNQPVTSVTSHPLLKRLKVCVKRLSLDAQGDPLEHKRMVMLKARSHRSSSLPIMSQ